MRRRCFRRARPTTPAIALGGRHFSSQPSHRLLVSTLRDGDVGAAPRCRRSLRRTPNPPSLDSFGSESVISHAGPSAGADSV
eukprot:12470871-Alexandrium_andersonii.AAC.1